MKNITTSDKKNYTPTAGAMLRNRLAKDCYPKLNLTMTQRARLTDIALSMSRANFMMQHCEDLIRRLDKLEANANVREAQQLLNDTKHY